MFPTRKRFGAACVPLLVVLWLVCAATVAPAALVTINNAGFEANALADGGISTSAPASWTLSGGTGGYFNPTVASYGYPEGDENELAFFFNPGGVISLHQDTAHVIALGDIIVLTIDFGNRGGSSASDPLNSLAAFGLYDTGGAAISTQSVSQDDLGSDGSLTSLSLNYTALPGDVGRTIRVRVSGGADGASGSDYVDFDNVTLDVTPVPEPAGYLWGGLALLAAACQFAAGMPHRRKTHLAK